MLAFATLLLFSPGCKKAEHAPEGTIQLYGVTVEIPKLDTEFKSANPDVQAAVGRVKTAYLRGEYMSMMMELDKLNNEPSLTEPQKKLVGNLLNEMKEVINKQGPPSAGQ